MSNTLTITPRMLLHEPFTICPKCKQSDFGVAIINDRGYVKRCASCRYVERHNLPPLQKKVVYLDQFVISNMMKALNPKDKAHVMVDPFWMEVFKRLDRLVKLQLIVCPDTSTQLDESLVAGPRYEPLRRIYELLSHGISFYNAETIKRFYVTHALHEWLGDAPSEPIDISDVTTDDINSWQTTWQISVRATRNNEETAESLRADRDSISAQLREVTKYWESKKGTSLKEFYEFERDAFGKVILSKYISSVDEALKMEAGLKPIDWSVYVSENSALMTEIHNILEEHGVQREQIYEKTKEFLSSDVLKQNVYIRISALMYASLARQVSLGRKKPISAGMVNDVTTISSIAPFCDAMFVDKECEFILSHEKTGLGIKTTFFSLRNKEDFLKYLDDIESSASPEHLHNVEVVYGKTWSEPYVDVLKNELE